MDELTNTADECLLVEFDDNFPFPKNKQDKSEQIKFKFIFDLITKCAGSGDLSFLLLDDQKQFGSSIDGKANIAIELPSILKDADYEKLLDDFEKCVAGGCINVPKILYSVFSYSGYDLPKSHHKRGNKMRKKLEKIAVYA
eukprot:423964_1